MAQQTPTDVESSPRSFNDHALPTFSVLLGSGIRHSWPLHLLVKWTQYPPAPIGGSGIGKGEVLEILIGDGETLRISGRSLDEITEALDGGRGGLVSQLDARYSSLAKKGRAFVSGIELEDAQEVSEI